MIKTRYLLGLPFLTFSINSIEVEAIIDTGFSGTAMIPRTLVEKLKLPGVAFTEYIAADGEIAYSEVFEAEVGWLGQKQRLAIITSDSDLALVGMELLAIARTILEPRKNILSIERSG